MRSFGKLTSKLQYRHFTATAARNGTFAGQTRSRAYSRLTEKTVFTQQGLLIGTPEYMSPEQAEMSGLDIDTTTDIYSLGVLLYQLLVGALPFDAKMLRRAGYEEIRRMIRDADPPRPTTRLSSLGASARDIAARRSTDLAALTRELRGDLEWITLKAMAKNRTNRYPTASELAAEIGRHLRHEPVMAGAPSRTYRIRKYVRRHRVGVTAAAIVILAVLVGTASTAIGFLRAVQAERKAAEEAAAAKQVSDFLVSIFTVSDPGKAKGSTITALEILDQGARKVEEELAGQPPVQARLMETMGSVYRSLGLYPQAQIIRMSRLRNITWQISIATRANTFKRSLCICTPRPSGIRRLGLITLISRTA